MIETVSIIATLLLGFGSVIAFLWQILGEVRIQRDKITANSTAITKLRTDVEIEFARCHQHGAKCKGASQND